MKIQIKTGGNSLYNYLLIFAITLAPVFSIYGFNSIPVSYGEGMLIIVLIIGIIGGKLNFNSNNVAMLFFVIYVITSAIVLTLFQRELILNDLVGHIARFIIIYFGLSCIFLDSIDSKSFIRFYLNLCVFFSVILIFQFIMLSLFGHEIHFLLKGVRLINQTGIRQQYENYVSHIHSLGFRADSVFTEPAHFAQYTMASIPLLLFTELSEKYKMLKSVIITMANLLSLSGIGITMMLIVWGCWIVINFKEGEKQGLYSIFYSALFVLVMIALNYNIFLDIIHKFIEKRDTIFIGYGESTGTWRILRGWTIWTHLDIMHKIVGVGLGNVEYFLKTNRLYTVYDRAETIGNEYMNALSYIIVSSGIIGVITFMIAIKAYIHNMIITQKVILLGYVFLLLTSSIYLNPISLLILMIISTGNLSEYEYI